MFEYGNGRKGIFPCRSFRYNNFGKECTCYFKASCLLHLSGGKVKDVYATVVRGLIDRAQWDQGDRR